MNKKMLPLICLTALYLSGCQNGPLHRHAKTKELFYKKVYGPQPSLLEEIGNPKNLDTVDVREKPVGKTYHDTFTKQRGYSQSSHFNPATF